MPRHEQKPLRAHLNRTLKEQEMQREYNSFDWDGTDYKNKTRRKRDEMIESESVCTTLESYVCIGVFGPSHSTYRPR